MPELVTIHRTADALEAEILGDLLVEEGIEARVLGARLGAAPLALASEMEARIDVPARDAGAARRVVAEHLAAVRVEPEPEDEDEPRDPPRLNPLLAAGVIGICPGGAHFYARRPLLAMAIGL